MIKTFCKVLQKKLLFFLQNQIFMWPCEVNSYVRLMWQYLVWLLFRRQNRSTLR